MLLESARADILSPQGGVGLVKLLSINEAANQLGVSDQTLRAWERKGLIKPIRLPSGYRRYTQEEINRLKRSMGLPVDEGAQP